MGRSYRDVGLVPGQVNHEFGPPFVVVFTSKWRRKSAVSTSMS